MPDRLSRDRLIEIVRRMLTGGYDTEDEDTEKVLLLEKNVPHPRVSALIFYPKRKMTPEEIVDEALAYKPQIIALPPPGQSPVEE